ncbi:MAG: AAA family ATPase [Hydrogenophaga sp.]|uniref:AAA family ATPase n=1 Tax=Hydrogenophaga sp. TaxID=1904254 RepID=UPI0026021F46|nr:AAA family ATPase [Hydrogenophaga sp.]MDM7941192.1 AAA family ATPase [Hydrogenophaga sp.]
MEQDVALGLFVGKFSPLHRGHAWCIDQAKLRCQRLIVLSWSRPELPGCEAPKRRRWLAANCFGVEAHVLDAEEVVGLRGGGCAIPALPTNADPDHLQRAFVADWCRYMGFSVDAVFTSEDYGEGFAEHLGRALGRPVRHIPLDHARRAMPVSASAIRCDIHGQRAWLAGGVYADFVERIALIGGESTGKSSLAQALADTLETQVVPEYGRELWLDRGGVLQAADMLDIARRQIEEERAASRDANRYLVCDTTPLVTLFYALDLFGAADPELHGHAQREYHHCFLCADDFKFVQDGTRRDAAFRSRQNDWYRGQLRAYGVPFSELFGSIPERVGQVLSHLRCDRP